MNKEWTLPEMVAYGGDGLSPPSQIVGWYTMCKLAFNLTIE
jgi:hypothetical protein